MCVKLHGGRSQLLLALQQSSIDRWIFENCDFCLPHLHSTPPLGGGFPSEYWHDVCYKQTRMVWLPESENVWEYDYSFWQNSRTWQTEADRRTPHDGIGRAYRATEIVPAYSSEQISCPPQTVWCIILTIKGLEQNIKSVSPSSESNIYFWVIVDL